MEELRKELERQKQEKEELNKKLFVEQQENVRRKLESLDKDAVNLQKSKEEYEEELKGAELKRQEELLQRRIDLQKS